MKKGILVVGLICAMCAVATLAFAAASQQGCESSGGRAAGCSGGSGGGGNSDGGGNNTPPGDTTVNMISNLSSSSSASSYSTSTATASSTATGLPVSVSVEGVGSGGKSGGTALYGPSTLHNTESFQVITPIGGIGVANSEEYEKVSRRIGIVLGAYQMGIFSKDEARAQVISSLEQMEDATQPCRVLGVLWKSRGKHLFNLLGLACTDSWR